MRTEGMDRSAGQACQDTRVAAILRQGDQEIEAAERKSLDALRLLFEEVAIPVSCIVGRTWSDRYTGIVHSGQDLVGSLPVRV